MHQGVVPSTVVYIPGDTRHQDAPIPPRPLRSPQTHNKVDVVYVTTQSTPDATAVPLLETQSPPESCYRTAPRQDSAAPRARIIRSGI